jgi:membrane fusion protein (multidrug efflux system)
MKVSNIASKLLLLIVLLTFLSSCKKEVVPNSNPLEVEVIEVLQQDVRLESEYTGQTFGQSDIQINPRVDGVIESLNFKEGSIVKKGELLYTIDPLQIQTRVSQAQGALAEAQASLSKTKSDLDMVEPLAKINALSQRELIAAKEAYNASLARMRASSASLENARIELSYCKITAPITGLIGMRCYLIKQIEPDIDKCIEWNWAKVAYSINDDNIYIVNTLGINICPGTNSYFLV